MLEKKLLQDIPNGRFHSAILTSYSIDFYFLEEQVLKCLRSKSIYNISVLVDEQMLDDSLGVFTSNLKHTATMYAINSVACKGVFHPKINLFLGYDEALVLVGSGNLTSLGHGRNHELWGAFYIDSNAHSLHPFLIQVWQYLESMYDSISGISQQKILWMKKHCSLLENIDTPYTPKFFYS